MAAKQQYEVLVGLDYPPDKRAEAGDLVDDLPKASVTWLLEQGFIRTPGAAPVPAGDGA